MERRDRPESQPNYDTITQEAISTWPTGTFLGQQYAVGPEADILVILGPNGELAQGPFSVGVWLAQNGFRPSEDAFGAGTWVDESSEYIWVTDPKTTFKKNRRPPGIYQLNSKTVQEMRGTTAGDREPQGVSIKGAGKNLPAKADTVSLPEGGSKDDGITVVSERDPTNGAILLGVGGLLAIGAAGYLFSRKKAASTNTTKGFMPVIPRERHIDALLVALERLSVSNPKALLTRYSEIFELVRCFIKLASPGATDLRCDTLSELAAQILELDEVKIELVQVDPSLYWPAPHVWLTPAHQVRMALLSGAAAERMKKMLLLVNNLQEAETDNSSLPKETLQAFRGLLMDVHGSADQKLRIIAALDTHERSTLLGDLQLLSLNMQVAVGIQELPAKDILQLLRESKAVALWLCPELVSTFGVLEDQWKALSHKGQSVVAEAFLKLLKDSGPEIMALLEIRKIIESRVVLTAKPQQPAPQQAPSVSLSTTSGPKFGADILNIS